MITIFSALSLSSSLTISECNLFSNGLIAEIYNLLNLNIIHTKWKFYYFDSLISVDEIFTLTLCKYPHLGGFCLISFPSILF